MVKHIADHKSLVQIPYKHEINLNAFVQMYRNMGALWGCVTTDREMFASDVIFLFPPF